MTTPVPVADAPARPRRALLLPGGPDFHAPERLAARLADLLGAAQTPIACDVGGLGVLEDAEELGRYDLVVPLWTDGELTERQERGLETAVRTGTALGGVHGAAAAFATSRPYAAVLGGQFVAHPGDEVPYRVLVDPRHPVTRPLRDFEVVTERYYLHVDPSNRVVASLRFVGDFGPLSANGPVSMPVAWTRRYGAGRVSYCALGHRPEMLDDPDVAALVTRGLRWAAGTLHEETSSG